MTPRIIAGCLPTRMQVREQSAIGDCRRNAKRLADSYLFDEESAAKIGIVVTELATNLIRHGGGGEMLLQVLDDGVAPQVEIMAIDSGEGMRDTERCFRDGYSTGGTAGTGLGAVRRLSALFDIFSAADQGTVAVSRIGRKGDAASPRSQSLEYGAVCLALEGEAECGDTWRVADGGARLALFVADGLGHGALAATAARAAGQAFAARPFEAPASGMQNLHSSLLGGRGAVAAWAELQVAEARVEYAGVGNISGVIVAENGTQGMVSYNGTLGVQLSRTRQFSYTWPTDSLVVMHSDGLSARWSLADYPGLYGRHAAVIAGVLYRESARKRDDVTVVIVRHGS
jgi:anti-sigma regulatory factor (Ser/Thr protein kinase)